jgi:hypothetical protein
MLDQERVDRVENVIICSGASTDTVDALKSACIMQLAAYVAGEYSPGGRLTDTPECTSPVIAATLRRWNDRLRSDEERHVYLRRFATLAVGTRSTPEIESIRRWRLVDWKWRVATPAMLRATGHEDVAALFAALGPIDGDGSYQAALGVTASARSALWDAQTKAHQGLRDKVTAAVKAKGGNADAYAAYAAAADAADADAAYAAYAYAAYAAAADAYAYAADAADAYAYADAAAAYAYAAAAAAAADAWRAKIREHLEKNWLPKFVPVRAQLNESLRDLLTELCEMES